MGDCLLGPQGTSRNAEESLELHGARGMDASDIEIAIEALDRASINARKRVLEVR